MIYIAGPFFGKKQKALLRDIAATANGAETRIFLPMDRDPRKPSTTEIAKEIHQSNVEGLKQCTAVVAVLDWLFEDVNTRLTVIGIQGVVPVHLPDTGTVWEMGYAHALGKPIIGYAMEPETKKYNLMLVCACKGFCYSIADLHEYFKHGILQPWKGSVN